MVILYPVALSVAKRTKSSSSIIVSK
jgi:hypothetical protein